MKIDIEEEKGQKSLQIEIDKEVETKLAKEIKIKIWVQRRKSIDLAEKKPKNKSVIN